MIVVIRNVVHFRWSWRFVVGADDQLVALVDQRLRPRLGRFDVVGLDRLSLGRFGTVLRGVLQLVLRDS